MTFARQRVVELQTVLLRAAEVAQPFLDSPVWEPAPGSEGFTEIANQEVGPEHQWGDIPVRTAHALTHALLDTVLFHVRALALLYVDEPPPMAPTTLARSVMEAGATAWWILQPGIGAHRARVARVTSERLRSSLEALKAISHLDEPFDPSDYSETQEQVRTYARSLGLAVAEGDPRVDGQVRPNSTDLISLLFETDTELNREQARRVYPVYSGVAHGLLYGIMQFLRPQETDHGVQLVWQTDPSITDAVVSYTLAILIASIDRLLAVMGWDASEWEGWKAELAEHFAVEGFE